ncbi:type II secretion system protein [Chloroflexota bacterium]
MKHSSKLSRTETGFTIVEILVVVAILAIIAVIVGVNAGKYIGRGETEAYAMELQNIQIAVTAMLHDSSARQLDSARTNIHDMDRVTADSGSLVLSNYLQNLVNEDGLVPTGCQYSFTVDGTVTQVFTPQ